MPLTPFQREVARLLAAKRTPESHLAGGSVINRADTSPRYSHDLDLFHDRVSLVGTYAEQDRQALLDGGFAFEWVRRETTGFWQASVTRGNESLLLDWTTDSTFRFFPVVPDDEFGYCLHLADLATNKALALAGRSEIRDFLDVLTLDAGYLSLGAIVWAACGKDEGYTPWSLLNMMKRHVGYRQEELNSERLVRPLSLVDLKERWTEAATKAEELFQRLPPDEVGCLYLDSSNTPVTPLPEHTERGQLRLHRGSTLGIWPAKPE